MTRLLSMNRPFGVPALAGKDRLKAGHRTVATPQSGSWSQCAPKMTWRLSLRRKCGTDAGPGPGREVTTTSIFLVSEADFVRGAPNLSNASFPHKQYGRRRHTGGFWGQ